MALKRPPSGRDCALAQAALEKLKGRELHPLSGVQPDNAPIIAKSGSGDAIQSQIKALNGFATLAMAAGPNFGRGAIRLIDLERRARFARVAS
jgi:hypothetical protein